VARIRTLMVPALTLLLAFLVGGLVVLFAHGNPITVYKSLFVGAGFDWPFHLIPGNPLGVNGAAASANLQFTLGKMEPLIFAGLAVAFAFRCGLFNIGGTGQLWVGAFAGFYVALHIGGIPGAALGAIVGAIAGAAWGAIAGGLKAYRGAHEVISTIMLNWIAIYGGQYLVSLGGPLQDVASGQPATESLPEGTKYKLLWGVIQGVDVGMFVALAAAVAFWAILNRTTLGYEVRAVGLNPEAARYGGVPVKRSIVLAMAISGAFAGLAGIGQVLGGYSHQIVSSNISAEQAGFTGIAIALLGRNTAVGVVLSALLFAALDSGAGQLHGFPTELARALATVIQGTIILIVAGEAIVRWLLARRGRGVQPPSPDVTLPDAATGLV